MSGNAADRPWSGRLRSGLPLAALVTSFALACGGGTEPRRAVALGLSTQPPSAAQSGVALSPPPVVELRDQDGSPFAQAGVSVTAAIADGGGTLGGAATRSTDSEGRATFADLVISGAVGPRTLRFTASGLSAVTSASIAVGPGPAATLEASSPTALQGTVNTAVATPPSVVVKDASGNPVPGVAVTFALASGGGIVSGTTQSTSAAGTATVGGWTLPTTVGQYTLSASVTGVANGVTFTATATPDAPSSMQASAGGGQSGMYGTRLLTPLQVRVVDQYGNPTPDVAVTWSGVGGSGTVEPLDLVTNANGIFRTNYRLGLVPGANLVRASIESRGLTVDFSATALGFTNRIALALDHSCALDETGVAYCWGQNTEGQVGDASTTDRNRPTAVGGALRFRRISAGVGVTCALTTDHVPYCWGSNRFGALGDGTTANKLAPTAVAGGHRFAEIATAGWVTCGLTADGAAYCWGANDQGQLGIGTGASLESCQTGGPDVVPCSRVPLQVAGGLSFASITASGAHACGLTGAGELHCWGNTTSWGDPWTGEPTRVPVRAASSHTFSEVSAGHGYTCAVGAGASAYCWGNGTPYGQLGDGAFESFRPAPFLLPNLAAAHIHANLSGTCALATDGRAFCWGFNGTGGVGDGTSTDRAVPTPVAGDLSFTGMNRSSYHGCGRIASGQLYCWGYNNDGQLGIGGGPGRLTPELVRP